MTFRSCIAIALMALLCSAPTRAETTPAHAPSPNTALALSLAGTAVPIGTALVIGEDQPATAVSLGITGVVLGPATGYFYAGHVARGWTGVALRAGTIAAGTGLLMAITPEEGFDGIDDGLAAAVTVVSLGATVLAVMTVADLAMVHPTVSAGRRVSVRARPASVGGAPGVALTARF